MPENNCIFCSFEDNPIQCFSCSTPTEVNLYAAESFSKQFHALQNVWESENFVTNRQSQGLSNVKAVPRCRGTRGGGFQAMEPGKMPMSSVVWLTRYRHFLQIDCHIGWDPSYLKRVLNYWPMAWMNSLHLHQLHTADPLSLPWDPLKQTVGNCRSRFFLFSLRARE